jgi:hypothetical protein
VRSSVWYTNHINLRLIPLRIFCAVKPNFIFGAPKSLQPNFTIYTCLHVFYSGILDFTTHKGLFSCTNFYIAHYFKLVGTPGTISKTQFSTRHQHHGMSCLSHLNTIYEPYDKKYVSFASLYLFILCLFARSTHLLIFVNISKNSCFTNHHQILL